MAAAWARTILAALLLMLPLAAVAGAASLGAPLRLGYLDHPGTALCLIAADKGYFKAEGVAVRLVRFADTAEGLAVLGAGKIDLGAFGVGETLRQIADGKGLRIIGGGGTERTADPLAELDEAAVRELENGGIVVVVAEGRRAPGKETMTRCVTALIRAHQALLKEPETAWHSVARQISQPAAAGSVHFDPSADYRRMERLWRSANLQGEGRPRDFLTSHVYEEIYCDALDRLVDRDGLQDEVLQKLFREAVCVPDCCPPDSKKRNKTKGGSS